MSLGAEAYVCVWSTVNGQIDLVHAVIFDGAGTMAGGYYPTDSLESFDSICSSIGGLKSIAVVSLETANNAIASAAGSPTFDVASLDPLTLVEAFTAGAAVMFPAYAIAWGAAFVVNSIRGRNG